MDNCLRANYEICRLTEGNYQLSHSDPLGQVEELLTLIGNYHPYNEERALFRSLAIKQLKEWERDLILGGCKVKK